MNTHFNLIASSALIRVGLLMLPLCQAQTNASTDPSIIRLTIRVHRFISDKEPAIELLVERR